MSELILKLFSLGTIFLLFIFVLFISLELFKIRNPLKSFIKANQMPLILITSIGATFGSLLLSFYFKLAPCDLCWYQRIFLFPIPVIVLIALIKKDLSARVYIFALSCVGLLIAGYHSILQVQIFKKDSVFCNTASVVDCATPDFVYYGFVTVPIISFCVFLVTLILSYPYEKK